MMSLQCMIVRMTDTSHAVRLPVFCTDLTDSSELQLETMIRGEAALAVLYVQSKVKVKKKKTYLKFASAVLHQTT